MSLFKYLNKILKYINNKTLKSKGFTIIELLVSFGIIVLMTGLVLANYKKGQEDFALQRSANKLAQDIRRAGQMAISTAECVTEQGVECDKKFSEGGYGIYAEQGNNFYLLYADDKIINGKYDDLNDTIIENNISLEEKVFIYNIFPMNSMSINFKAPEPAVSISGTGTGPAEITLSLENDFSKTITIKVYETGLVEIQKN